MARVHNDRVGREDYLFFILLVTPERSAKAKASNMSLLPDVPGSIKHELEWSVWYHHRADIPSQHMNADGLKDIVVGKRFWAHGPTGDVEPNAPAVVYWFELQRPAGGQATFVPHLVDDDSGVGTQVTAADLNGDRRPDVIAANKKGIFVHLSEVTKP